MVVARKPARWKSSDDALRAVQVAFDVEEAVMEAVRGAAFHNNVSPSDQIRRLLSLPTTERPKRPRLTVTLSAEDYEVLGQRYGLEAQEKLAIKEKVTEDLISFAASAASPRGRRRPA